MTQNEARNIMYQAFIDGWDPSAPAVPYCFANEDFDAKDLLEYVRVSVRHGQGGQWTLGQEGGRVYRRRGVAYVEVYSPVDRGLLRLDELTQAARGIFEGKNLSQVCFNDGQILELPAEGKWARGDVSVAFTYDETK
ncbi:MAG: phage tail terminator-like protein [Candidatus Thorarchaeota archaeon]